MVLLLLVGGCSFLVFRVASAPIDAANEWVALVDEGRYGEAYDAFCSSLQGDLTRADAEVELASDFDAGIDGYRISNYQNNNGNVMVGGEVTVGGSDRPITLFMDDGSGDWKVCGYVFEVLEVGTG